jgi:ribokinase
MAGRVCILGSANMDLVVRAPHLPGPGETILGGPFETFPGGKGANQAVAAARMGAQVSFVGRVGADAYGAELRSLLSREGVDMTALRPTAGNATGVALISVADAGGENTIIVAPGANQRITRQDIEAVGGLIRSADVLLMQLEVPLDAVAAAGKIARAAGRRVVLNAAPALALERTLLGEVDVLVVNRPEAGAIAGASGEIRSRDLAKKLRELGPRAVIITLGPRGALVAEADEPVPVPSIEIEATDTVGAGDAFCGTLAAILAEGKSLVEAARVGCVAGALAASKAGAIPSLPTREAVGKALQS